MRAHTLRWICWGLLCMASTVHAKDNKVITAGGANPAAMACATCHGADGAGMAEAGFPRLAGLPQAYIVKQLHNFQQNTRQNPVMQPVAMALSESEIQSVAAAYASMAAAPAVKPASTGFQEGSGAWIAANGAWDRNVPACASCHGPGGIGVGGSFPPLAGQSAQYIEAQLHAWRSAPNAAATRMNDPQGMMKHVAESLTEPEIQALAAYYGSNGQKGVEALPEPGVSSTNSGFQPPSEKTLPDNEFGKMVLKGKAYFMNTHEMAPQYVGNSLNCVNCHLDAGRKAGSAPLWAAYPMYPAYRKKNNKVNNFIERLQGCFKFSMNGQAPAADSEILKAMEVYAYWLSTGAPLGKALPGRGYEKPTLPQGGYDPLRGQVVYQQKCAVCHGDAGQGQQAGGHSVFPPLWGKNSFNWGAGMHRVDTAAAFIKHNMPLGQGASLSDQEAWDVAAFVDSRERPQDPRMDKASVEEIKTKYHSGDKFDYYGQKVDGKVLSGLPKSK